MLRTALALAGLALAAPDLAAQNRDKGELPPLNDREKAHHLLSRCAFGHRPGQIEEVLRMGIEDWIEAQIQPRGYDPGPLDSFLSQYDTLDMTTQEILDFYLRPRGQSRAGRREAPQSPEERRRAAQDRNRPRSQMVYATLARQIMSARQLEEILVEFWRNHFNVSYTKGSPMVPYITGWDRDVLRAHVWGDFHSFLEATAKHPAMLIYLDNALSRRPPSAAELRRIEQQARRQGRSREQARAEADIAQQRGLNENYARELLELHTLGVDNGYKQRDVVAVAEALTGWTYSPGRGEFQFRNGMHVPGKKKVLGRTIRTDADNGVVEGEAILEMLAHHKGTAEFISRKLVRYLVNDNPPESLVKEVARVFRKTDGDLTAMYRTILASEEFWSRENYQAKFKTPLEFVVSCLRVTGAEVQNIEPLAQKLREMGQGPWLCDDPTGYYDTAEAWLDPGVMATRWQFALDLVEGRFPGIRVPDSLYDGLDAELPRLWQVQLTDMILPAGASERTRAVLSQVTDEYLATTRKPDPHVLGPRLLGLLLGSPEFQLQ